MTKQVWMWMGKLHWVHVIRTPKLTYYDLSAKRGQNAMNEIGFLAHYHSVIVHDFWRSYFKATDESMPCAVHTFFVNWQAFLRIILNRHGQVICIMNCYPWPCSWFYNQNPEIDSRQFYMDCLKQKYDTIPEMAIQQNPLPEQNKKWGRKKGDWIVTINGTIGHCFQRYYNLSTINGN